MLKQKKTNSFQFQLKSLKLQDFLNSYILIKQKCFFNQIGIYLVILYKK